MPKIIRLFGQPIDPDSSQAQGLIAHWPLNDNDTLAHDSLNKYDGTITAATSVVTYNGLGRSFNGTNSYIDFGNNANFYFPGAFSVSLNIVLLAYPGDAYGGYIISDYNNNYDASSFSLFVQGSRGGSDQNKLTFFWENSGYPFCVDPDVTPLNTLINVVFMWDGVKRSIYTNGTLKATESTAQPRSDIGGTLVLGRPGQYSGTSNHVNAIINDVRIYNRALNFHEVFDIYNNPNGLYSHDPEIYLVSSGITGTLARTLSNDTLSASGITTVKGTLAETLSNDTLAASGTTTITVVLAETLANDTLAASGSPIANGSLAKTLINDTLAASGNIGSSVSGSLTETNASDTLAASGTTTIIGALAKTLVNDILAANGSAIVKGSLARTLSNDALVASGASGSAVSGDLAVTLANDTLAAAGKTTVIGLLDQTLENDNLAAIGSTTVISTLAKALTNDVLSASGTTGIIAGSVNVTLGNDSLIASGRTLIETFKIGGVGKKSKKKTEVKLTHKITETMLNEIVDVLTDEEPKLLEQPVTVKLIKTVAASATSEIISALPSRYEYVPSEITRIVDKNIIRLQKIIKERQEDQEDIEALLLLL